MKRGIKMTSKGPACSVGGCQNQTGAIFCTRPGCLEWLRPLALGTVSKESAWRETEAGGRAGERGGGGGEGIRA
jgi:hypothetical protein